MSCKGCGSNKSKAIKNENNVELYWMGAYKDTLDFSILSSNLEFHFTGVSVKQCPPHSNRYDYYCTDCFLKTIKKNKNEK